MYKFINKISWCRCNRSGGGGVLNGLVEFGANSDTCVGGVGDGRSDDGPWGGVCRGEGGGGGGGGIGLMDGPSVDVCGGG